MVKLRNLLPLTQRGLEIAYRFEFGAADLSLEEWLETFPDQGARLAALTDLLCDPTVFEVVTNREDAQALRVATEVVDIIAHICRGPDTTIFEIVDNLMAGSTGSERADTG